MGEAYEVAESLGFCLKVWELVGFNVRIKVFQKVFFFEYVLQDGKTKKLMFLHFQISLYFWSNGHF